MKYYIVLDEADDTKYAIIGTKGFKPSGAICEAPKDVNGDYIKDPSVIRIDDIQPMVDQHKQAVDGLGNPIFETLQRQTYDIQGQPILDGNGDPVMEDYQSPVIELDGNGDPVMESVPFGDTYKQAFVDSGLNAARVSELAANKTTGDWAKLRRDRDKELKDSDFSQLADSPLDEATKAAYVTYRQALRDLPANTVDPLAPTWPVKP